MQTIILISFVLSDIERTKVSIEQRQDKKLMIFFMQLTSNTLRICATDAQSSLDLMEDSK